MLSRGGVQASERCSVRWAWGRKNTGHPPRTPPHPTPSGTPACSSWSRTSMRTLSASPSWTKDTSLLTVIFTTLYTTEFVYNEMTRKWRSIKIQTKISSCKRFELEPTFSHFLFLTPGPGLATTAGGFKVLFNELIFEQAKQKLLFWIERLGLHLSLSCSFKYNSFAQCSSFFLCMSLYCLIGTDEYIRIFFFHLYYRMATKNTE